MRSHWHVLNRGIRWFDSLLTQCGFWVNSENFRALRIEVRRCIGDICNYPRWWLAFDMVITSGKWWISAWMLRETTAFADIVAVGKGRKVSREAKTCLSEIAGETVTLSRGGQDCKRSRPGPGGEDQEFGFGHTTSKRSMNVQNWHKLDLSCVFFYD